MAQNYGRSPCGGRGLKLGYEVVSIAKHQSLPLRGAWIEILYAILSELAIVVAPLAGGVD